MTHTNVTALLPTTAPTTTDLPYGGNDGGSSLLAEASAVATSFSVGDISNYPTPCIIRLGNERVLITSKTAVPTQDAPNAGTLNTALAYRGYDGSTAAVQVQGTRAMLAVVGYLHNRLAAEVIALGQMVTGALSFKHGITVEATVLGEIPLTLILADEVTSNQFVSFKREVAGVTTEVGAIVYDATEDSLEFQGIDIELGTNSDLILDDGRNLYFGTSKTIGLSRGADNRLDLATGDSFNIVLGNLQMAGTTLFESDLDLAVTLTPNATLTLDAGSATRYFREGYFDGILSDPKGAYAATVYKRSGLVIARTAAGVIISSGTAGSGDTTVIAAAITNVQASGGGTVFVAPGTYTGVNVTLPGAGGGVSLKGEAWSTIFEFSAGTCITVGANPGIVAIEGLTINSTAAGVGTAIGGTLGGGHVLSVRNVNVTNTEYGLNIVNSYYLDVSNVRVNACTYGVKLTGAIVCNVRRTNVGGCTTYGYWLVDCQAPGFDDCDADGNGTNWKVTNTTAEPGPVIRGGYTALSVGGVANYLDDTNTHDAVILGGLWRTTALSPGIEVHGRRMTIQNVHDDNAQVKTIWLTSDSQNCNIIGWQGAYITDDGAGNSYFGSGVAALGNGKPRFGTILDLKASTESGSCISHQNTAATADKNMFGWSIFDTGTQGVERLRAHNDAGTTLRDLIYIYHNGGFDIRTGGLLLGGTQLYEQDGDLALTLTPNADITLNLGSSTRRFTTGFMTGIQPGATPLDILTGNDQGIRLSDASADAATKEAYFRGRHYLTAEEDLLVFDATSTVAANTIFWGGGAASFNAATKHSFYAAATNNVLTGTLILDVTTAGIDIKSGAFLVGATPVIESDRDVAINWTPNADNTLTDGTAARRWASSHSVLFDVRAAASDANPTARLLTSALSLGINSADALSVTLSVTTTNRLDLATGDSFRLVNGDLQYGTTGTGIRDANGNEMLLFTQTASAVNELTLANAATGNAPTLSATGGDADISLTLHAKGTGDVNIGTGGLALSGTRLVESDLDFAVDILGNADNTLDVGSAARRFAEGHFVTIQVDAAASDANPKWKASASGIELGAGGATALSWKISFDSADTALLADGDNIKLGTVTGSKIGTGATEKLGFYGATPVVQGASISDPAAMTSMDAPAAYLEASMQTELDKANTAIAAHRTAIIAIISRLEALGVIATV